MIYTPPAPRTLSNSLTKQRKARTTLAWLTFITLYIALPILIISAITNLNAHAHATTDRADAFYQQTQHATN